MTDPMRDPLAAMFDPNKKITKAERIRDYLELHPERRNKDIAAELSEFGVKPQDVANVRTSLRKAGAAVKEHKVGRPRKAAPIESNAEVADVAKTSLPNYMDVKLVELGLAFVRACGDIQRAEMVLTMIRKIREL